MDLWSLDHCLLRSCPVGCSRLASDSSSYFTAVVRLGETGWIQDGSFLGWFLQSVAAATIVELQRYGVEVHLVERML